MNAPNREIIIDLPVLHPDQVRFYLTPGRFKALRAGRRYGKTELGITWAGDGAARQMSVGWFAPEYKFLTESYVRLHEMLLPIKRGSSQNAMVIRTVGGGRIDFWSLDNPLAGRGRKYHRVVMDEAAFTKAEMIDTWERAIRPTLVDYRGEAWALSNTKGLDAENFLWKICNEPKYGFVDYHAPSRANPYLPQEELDEIEAKTDPRVFAQEYKAEFIDWSGAAFFSTDNLLYEGKPVAMPEHCDAVFAVVDTAAKTGSDNDGTAVIYCAYTAHMPWPLLILDWEVQQIQGNFLTDWLPSVFATLEKFAGTCGARRGAIGTWIEDKSTGIVLLQHALHHNWPVQPIDSKLTAMGKDERAISVSGNVYRGEVKYTTQAFNRVSQYKGVTRNHLVSQIAGFHVGDKDAAKRSDDLLDCFCYSVSIALGNAEGF